MSPRSGCPVVAGRGQDRPSGANATHLTVERCPVQPAAAGRSRVPEIDVRRAALLRRRDHPAIGSDGKAVDAAGKPRLDVADVLPGRRHPRAARCPNPSSRGSVPSGVYAAR